MAAQTTDSINYKAWASNMLTFIREHDLEDRFTDWCGGWAYPGAPEPTQSARAALASSPMEAVKAAVEDEREACAKVAEAYRSGERTGSLDRLNGHAEAARDISTAIRSRGEG